jgi:hypothetical protein
MRWRYDMMPVTLRDNWAQLIGTINEGMRR